MSRQAYAINIYIVYFYFKILSSLSSFKNNFRYESYNENMAKTVYYFWWGWSPSGIETNRLCYKFEEIH